MSHPYMIHDALGDTHRSAHQEILKKEQAREDDVVNALLICRRIMEIWQTGIDIGLFLDGYGARDVVESMMTEALKAA